MQDNSTYPNLFLQRLIGGMAEFERHDISVYASKKTIGLLKGNDQKLTKPIKDFYSSLTLDVENKKVYAEYLGGGHTEDNIVGYFPNDNSLFEGCLTKEVGANKGNLVDANVKEWPRTIKKIKLKYPNTKIVIPGHGKWGDTNYLITH